MMKTRFGRQASRVSAAIVAVLLLWPSGCVKPIDVRSIAEGQFISFINAIVNTATGDAVRGALGG